MTIEQYDAIYTNLVQMIRIQERERIIKLLETLKEWESPIPVRESHVDSIIALIKGDDK